MNPQRKALRQIAETGNADGINKRTMETLERRGNIERAGNGWSLTKRGNARNEGRLGNAANLTRMWEKNEREHALKGAEKGGKKTPATRSTKAAWAKEAHAEARFEHQQKQDAEKQRKRNVKAMYAVLGPTGTAQAVKISRADGGLFSFDDVDKFEDLGWKVTGASSVAARPGSVRLPGEPGGTVRNPAPFGEHGTARAIVLLGSVTMSTIKSLQRDGYDVSAAPKRLREAVTTNPGNPHKDAERKAAAFYGAPELATAPRELRKYKTPEAYIHIGKMAAIEYDCDKYDGKPRIWRHESTRERNLYISIDGSTLVIDPPFRITKRGIEG